MQSRSHDINAPNMDAATKKLKFKNTSAFEPWTEGKKKTKNRAERLLK